MFTCKHIILGLMKPTPLNLSMTGAWTPGCQGEPERTYIQVDCFTKLMCKRNLNIFCSLQSTDDFQLRCASFCPPHCCTRNSLFLFGGNVNSDLRW